MKTPIIYILIITGALGVGIGGGFAAKKLFGEEEIVYEGDASSYEVNGAEVLRRYEKYTGSSPETDFTAAELIGIGLEKYRNCDYCYSYGVGTAHTMVEQEVRNFQIKNGDQYFEESISSSKVVSIAKRMKQKGKDGDILLYNGRAIDAETGDYNVAPVTYSQSDYANFLGRTLDKMFIYLIGDKTVLDSKITKNDGYVVKVSLDPTFATSNYKLQMKNISGLDKLPKFEYVNLTFTFDKDLNLKTLDVDEHYQATMGFTVPITNEISYKYFSNVEMKIPADDEALSYKGV